ncbi:MAG: cupin-like domain-containing protein [Saprospiraceae bacterium]|nr:cupin-like domain-containing protein [Saprospiraceae bacterium]
MLKITQVEKIANLTNESFAKNYLQPLKPVVFTDLTKNWKGLSKWTIDFFKKEYGHLEVPVTTPNYSKPGKNYMEPDMTMSFREYLDLMEKGPIPYRIFLWNIFKLAPELIQDFSIHTIMDGFINDYPFMFFGGEGSVTAMHYDIDLSHVFLNQLHGRKRVVLFAHDQSINLYQHPYTVASYIDINNPDYDHYPALSKVNGFETIIYPGETLFIPSGYWHYIEYLDGGYSIALRANESLVRRAKGAINIAKHYIVDKGMNKLLGTKWNEMKENLAHKRADEVLI